MGSGCPRQVRREKSEPGTPIPVGQGGYTWINTTSSRGKVLAGGVGYVKTIGKSVGWQSRQPMAWGCRQEVSVWQRGRGWVLWPREQSMWLDGVLIEEWDIMEDTDFQDKFFIMAEREGNGST